MKLLCGIGVIGVGGVCGCGVGGICLAQPLLMSAVTDIVGLSFFAKLDMTTHKHPHITKHNTTPVPIIKLNSQHTGARHGCHERFADTKLVNYCYSTAPEYEKRCERATAAEIRRAQTKASEPPPGTKQTSLWHCDSECYCSDIALQRVNNTLRHERRHWCLDRD